MDNSDFRPSDWIQLGTAIVTLITAAATFYTVYEMRASRKQSIKPLIFQQGVKGFFKIVDQDSSAFGYDYSISGFKIYLKRISSLDGACFIELANIGRGPCKNISCSYFIDDVEKKRLKQLFDEYKDESNTYTVEKGSDSLIWNNDAYDYKVSKQSATICAFCIDTQYNFKKGFITNYGEYDSKFDVPVPLDYILIYYTLSTILEILPHDKSKYKSEDAEINFYLLLDYEDFDGKHSRDKTFWSIRHTSGELTAKKGFYLEPYPTQKH